jgi:hypothetical protein
VADKTELEKLDLNGKQGSWPQHSPAQLALEASLTYLSFLPEQVTLWEKRAVSSFRRC